MTTEAGTVVVEAPARLHFGVLDLRGSLGRWFGGIGAPAPGPVLRLSARRAEGISADGPDRDRAVEFARRVRHHHHLSGGVHITVEQPLPSHSGLGSGTQLGLAVARALADLYGLPADAAQLARAAGRARRSAIGTWVFANGGLVVEGGRPREGDACGPLIARIELPATWQCVIAVPGGQSGISGAIEARAFDTLPQPPEQEVERVAHLVLMALLPAAAEGDLATFGRALTEIQQLNGRWFAPVQGGTFAATSRRLIDLMLDEGAAGAGQSSWGPAVYGVVESAGAAARLAQRLEESLGSNGLVCHGLFPAHGARVWRKATP